MSQSAQAIRHAPLERALSQWQTAPSTSLSSTLLRAACCSTWRNLGVVPTMTARLRAIAADN